MIELAKSIAFLCNGEYGTTYWNKSANKIFINVGDSNPFDIDYLKAFVKEILVDNYTDQKYVEVDIDNECGPPTEIGWTVFNDKDKFIKYTN